MSEGPTFQIFVNNQEFSTGLHEMTGSAIKKLAGVPNEYELWEVKGDKTEPVGNDQVVHIHNKMHFRAIPAGTFGAYGTSA